MKTLTLAILCLAFFSMLQSSCLRSVDAVTSSIDTTKTIPKMTACHNQTVWDSSAIHNKLISKWDWQYISCFWSPEKANSKDYLGLEVEFKTDNTLTIKQNGTSAQTATWFLEKLNDGYYKLNVKPFVLQLPGRIMFCNNNVVFSDSYIDGCDNYFAKKN